MHPSRLPRELLFPALVTALAGSGVAQRGAPIRFDDVTATVGLDVSDLSWGAAWGDWDGDGRPDLWLGGHSRIRLFHNRADGSFLDVAATVLRSSTSPPALRQIAYGDRHAAAWADFDGDGDDDLLQCIGAERGRGSGPNQLFRNEAGLLRQCAAEFGLDRPQDRGRVPLWIDADRDGALDVVLVNAARDELGTVLLRQRDGRFEAGTGPADTALPPAEFGLLLPGDRPSAPLLMLVPPLGGRTFALEPEGPRSVGLPHLMHFARDAVAADLDNDGGVEIVAALASLRSAVRQRGPHEVDVLAILEGSPVGVVLKTDGDLAVTVGPVGGRWWQTGQVHLGAAGASPDALEFVLYAGESAHHGLPEPGEQGRRGIAIGRDAAAGVWRLRVDGERWHEAQLIVQSSAPITGIETDGIGPSRAQRTPRLFSHRGGRWLDCSDWLGPAVPRHTGSIGAADFDNDMDVDLYVVCSAWIGNAPNLLLVNDGTGRFTAIEDAGGAACDVPGRGDAVATADYDLDGCVDLFVTNGRGLAPLGIGSHRLFRNRGNQNHWLQIDLRGTTSNPHGIGARVLATAGGVTQVRLADNGMHGFAQNFRRLHFGLAEHTAVDELRIEWPSGIVQTLRDVAADRVLLVTEPDR